MLVVLEELVAAAVEPVDAAGVADPDLEVLDTAAVDGTAGIVKVVVDD